MYLAKVSSVKFSAM